MSDQESIEIGGANISAIGSVIEKAPSTLSVANSGSLAAFLDGWIAKLKAHVQWLSSQNKQLSAPVTIVYVENSGKEGRRLGWTRRSMIGTNPSDELSGALIVTSTSTGGYVMAGKLSSTEEIENEIYSGELQEKPTIVLTQSAIFYWVDGIGNDGEPIEVSLDGLTIVIDEDYIETQLNRFYEYHAITNKNWWKDAPKFITKSSPENLVQSALLPFLTAMMAERARVKEEENVGNGRADITIRPRKKNEGHQSSVLELKTLRSYLTPQKDGGKAKSISDKDNIDWASSGIQQAAAYRDDESLDLAFLCLYDFRKKNDDNVDNAISAGCIAYKVKPLRFWITASHEAYRKANYPLPQND
ncbi:hypothetical protein [Chromobacterium haemolyticum]|uniref:hypothetical protein n=1 Tax=Chromobacterium haemolyticum TaxID=394935 RepID=UPI00131753E3|nr:hypothetical protein [Chromobacterium haemolyticum]BBH15053.1 hypothetical protein CH06BL_43010 [Chromobacterium haemolyticum]